MLALYLVTEAVLFSVLLLRQCQWVKTNILEDGILCVRFATITECRLLLQCMCTTG